MFLILCQVIVKSGKTKEMSMLFRQEVYPSHSARFCSHTTWRSVHSFEPQRRATDLPTLESSVSLNFQFRSAEILLEGKYSSPTGVPSSKLFSPCSSAVRNFPPHGGVPPPYSPLQKLLPPADWLPALLSVWPSFGTSATSYWSETASGRRGLRVQLSRLRPSWVCYK